MPLSPDHFTNIASHLPAMAQQQPDTVALHLPQRQGGTLSYRQVTFSELDRASDHMALALQGYGIGRGMRTALMVTPGFEFFALTFALFKLGAVPVLIDPGMGVKNLKVCLAEAQPAAFIGIPKAHVARLLFGWARGSLRHLVTVGDWRLWGGKTLAALLSATPQQPFPMAATRGDETAAILFTSGSTGVPKGAVYSHANFCAQVELLKAVYDIRPGEIDLPTFPLFALFAPALGMSAVIPEMDFTRPGSVDAAKLCTAIQSLKITTMFGSPALIRRVADYGVAHHVQLPSLKRAISAGAPVPAAVLERFTRLLVGDAQIFTPYGATEALPVCSISSREILGATRRLTEQGAGVCVGMPVPGIQVEIITVDDGPLARWSESLRVAPGEIGEIAVKGPQVTAGYFNRPESTALGKIADPAGGFFHRMGDLGYRDAEGRIWFCGRKAHRVVTATATLFTIPCEAIFNTHPQVFRSALVGIGPAGAQTPVICIELEPGTPAAAQEKIRSELLRLGQRNVLTRPITTLLFHPAFPVDIRHNAKIFREKLAVWAAAEVEK